MKARPEKRPPANFDFLPSSYTVDGTTTYFTFNAFKTNFSFPILKKELRKSVSRMIILISQVS